MVKKIWIVNPYVEPPHLETRIRGITVAKYLVNQGYEVTLFGGSFIHNTDIDLIETSDMYVCKQYEALNFVHIKTPSYTGNGAKRFINLHTFYKRFKKIYKNFETPDLIWHTGTIPFGFKMHKIAKKMNSQYITEICDLWPESFVCYDLIKRDSMIHKLLKKIEFCQYKNSDKIIFSMEGGKDYIKNQGWGNLIDLDNVYYVNNGVELSEFYKNVETYKIEDEDLTSDKFKVVYLGSIRLANNLMQLIKAAESIMQQGNDNIQFLIYGDGTERESLEKYVLENHLTNVKFKQKFVEIQYVPYILSSSNLNILNYMDNDIWNYGGSQSKLFQYMASGKPILSNLKIGYCIITKNKCGLAKSFRDSEEYANSILSFYKMDKKEYSTLCHNAKEAAKKFDYEKLTEDLIKIFNK